MMERYVLSGQSVQVFCAAEQIKPVTFYYWRKRLHMQENPESSILVPVCIEKVGPPSRTDRETLELAYPNGVRLFVPHGSELNLIRELVMLL